MDTHLPAGIQPDPGSLVVSWLVITDHELGTRKGIEANSEKMKNKWMTMSSQSSNSE